MIQLRDRIVLFVITVASLVLAISVQTTTVQTNGNEVVALVDDSLLHFDAIKSISIQRDSMLLEFEKKDGAWMQVAPFRLRMDPTSMRALIESVQGLQIIGALSEEPSDEVIGVAEGANFIELSDGTRTVRVILGRKTLGGRAYAKINGGVPVLIGQSLHRRAIDMDYRLWRDIRLFPDFAIDGERIERNANGDRLLIERIDGRWKMRDPVSARVNQTMLTEWVGTLAAARVGRYVVDEPDDLAMFGLDTPTATFSTTDRKGNVHALWIGGRVSAGSQDRYVMLAGKPVVFRMTMDALSQLFPVPEMFVESMGSAVSKFDVKQVIIRIDDRETKFSRKIERWVDVQGIQADGAAIESLLRWILETNPLSVAIAPYPRDQEVATITLVGYDSLPLDTVRIALDESGQWILENGDNVLRLHPSESGEAFASFQH